MGRRARAETFQEKLSEIKKTFGRRCSVISHGTKNSGEPSKKNIPQKILGILKRRPVRESDLKKILNIDGKIIQKELWLLERKRKAFLKNGWWVSA